jgi:F-type H+-transporting ATPase subunit epsilon
MTIHVDIVSAEALIYSGVAAKLVVRAYHGELCILPGHAPLIARLRPGAMRLTDVAGRERHFMVSSGLLEVQPHVATVLADTVFRNDELDADSALAAKTRAEENMRCARSKRDYERCKSEAELLTLLLRQLNEARIRR